MEPTRREIPNLLGTSFLDVLSCALGGFILMVLLLTQKAGEAARTLRHQLAAAEAALDQARGELVRARSALHTARAQAEGALAAADRAGTQLADLRDRLAQTRAEAVAETARHASALASLERDKVAARSRGFEVPVPLAIRIDWGRKGIDIDLAVTGPDGLVARYPESERNRSFGNLMRDEVKADKDTWEVFYSMDPRPGRYQVACSYYTTSPDLPVVVEGVVVLYPADPGKRREQRFRVVLRAGDKYPRRAVGSFAIGRSGSGWAIDFGTFVDERV